MINSIFVKDLYQKCCWGALMKEFICHLFIFHSVGICYFIIMALRTVDEYVDNGIIFSPLIWNSAVIFWYCRGILVHACRMKCTTTNDFFGNPCNLYCAMLLKRGQFSKISHQKTPHNSPARARYGVSFGKQHLVVILHRVRQLLTNDTP